MQKLHQRVAVVTGAASGIGAALARRLAAEGMKLTLADIHEEGLAAVTRELVDSGGEVLSVPTDVGRPEQMDQLAEQTLSRFGAAHLLCNNAGVGGLASAVWEMSPDQWDWVIGINVLGVINGLRSFVPILMQQDEAHIVNTASIAGLDSGVIGSYAVTKHAVVVLTEVLNHSLAERAPNVRVSVFCPGPVQTGLMSTVRWQSDVRTADDQVVAAYKTLGERVAAGIQPTDAVDILMEGIRADRFYILTHPELGSRVRLRAEDIVAGRAPTRPPTVPASADA